MRIGEFEEATLVHLTHEGAYAGVPFCGVDKGFARCRGEVFSHPPYNPAGWKALESKLCPHCKAEWDIAGD